MQSHAKSFRPSLIAHRCLNLKTNHFKLSSMPHGTNMSAKCRIRLPLMFKSNDGDFMATLYFQPICDEKLDMILLETSTAMCDDKPRIMGHGSKLVSLFLPRRTDLSLGMVDALLNTRRPIDAMTLSFSSSDSSASSLSKIPFWIPVSRLLRRELSKLGHVVEAVIR